MRFLSLVVAFVAGLGLALTAAWGLKKDVQPPLTTTDVQGIVSAYLRDHPDAVVDAIRAYQAKAEKTQREEQQKLVSSRWQDLIGQADDPVLGNPQGNATLVEFFDYRCGYCRRAHPDVMALKNSDPQLRIVMKEFPILGPESVIAAQASLASHRQGKYEVFHDALMTAPGQLDEIQIYEIAEQVGLDVDQLRRDMDSPEVEKILRRNFEIAQQLGLKGTPVFMTRTEIVPGAVGAEALKALVEGARKGSS